MKINQIIRYPIKGFQGESIQETTVFGKSTITGDREFAIKYTDRKWPTKSEWLPKQFFMQSTKTDVCAMLELKWQVGKFELSDGSIFERSLEGITRFANRISDEHPRLGSFEAYTAAKALTDEPRGFISVVNLATIDAIANATRTRSTKARYRANLYIDNLDAFAETDWIGRRIRVGSSECRIVEQIKRCSATEFDWQGGRNLSFVQQINEAFKTECCGIFLIVERGGVISKGDTLQLLDKE